MAKGKTATTTQSFTGTSRKTRSQDHLEQSIPAPAHTRKRLQLDSNIIYSPPKRTRRTTEATLENSAADTRPEQDGEPASTPAVAGGGAPHNLYQTSNTQFAVANQGDSQMSRSPKLSRQRNDSPASPGLIESAEPQSPQIRRSQRRRSRVDNDFVDLQQSEVQPTRRSQPTNASLDVLADYQKRPESAIRADPRKWVRTKALDVLETMSNNILTLFVEISPADWLHFRGATELVPLQQAWAHLSSMFTQVKSIIYPDSILVDDISTDEVETERHAFSESVHLVNLSTALLILMKPAPTYYELKALSDNFANVFPDASEEFPDWLIELNLDLAKATWKIGVDQGVFSAVQGLDEIFLTDSQQSISEEIDRRMLAYREETKDRLEETAPPMINFGFTYGEELAKLAQEMITLAPASERNTPPADQVSHTEDAVHVPDLTGVDLEAGTIPAYDTPPHPASAPNGQSSSTQINGISGLHLADNNSADIIPHSPSQPVVGTRHDNTLPIKDGPWSTREQYQRAKLAAAEKAAARNRGVPIQPSQRRPWSPEEENALMSGLDKVQGPHWSQILAMYGQGGSISEVLKDRNQVQLKDKARNLKLFFLKSGHEVPHYLKNVTGELKTRAPSSAARHGNAATEDIYRNETPTTHKPNAFLSTSSNVYARPAGDKGMPTTAGQEHVEEDPSRSREDEEDLSNAIQLALQAIREKNGPQADNADGQQQDAVAMAAAASAAAASTDEAEIGIPKQIDQANDGAVTAGS